MPELIPSDPPEPTEPDDDAPTSVRDNWWWSPAVAIVAGAAVVMFQKPSLTGSGGNPLNWVVAGLGIALACSGIVRLVRAYPR